MICPAYWVDLFICTWFYNIIHCHLQSIGSHFFRQCQKLTLVSITTHLIRKVFKYWEIKLTINKAHTRRYTFSKNPGIFSLMVWILSLVTNSWEFSLKWQAHFIHFLKKWLSVGVSWKKWFKYDVLEGKKWLTSKLQVLFLNTAIFQYIQVLNAYFPLRIWKRRVKV